MIILLDVELAVKSSTTPIVPRPLKWFLQSLMHLPQAGQRTTVSELQEARARILDSQQKIKRAFRLLWNLYIISEQQENAAVFPVDIDSIGSVAGTLGAISWELLDDPSGISPQNGSFLLSVLNSDYNAVSKMQDIARKLGKGCTDRLMNRYRLSANQLVDVQITLFELIWSGTIRQLGENPTRNADDPEHTEFGQILDQLDSSLQDVIARSRRPRFTLSFYGMAKAGKTSLLNALIGKAVLPSNGRDLGIAYLCGTDFYVS